MAAIQGKKMIPMYVEESIYREIKVYAAQTDQTMQVVMKSLSDEFEQSAIRLVTQIKEMKRQAEEQRLKEEEEARIVSENPLIVTGHEVDPLGMTVEPSITS